MALFPWATEAGPPRPKAPLAASGVSIGAPNEGHLEGGVRLEERPYLKILPGHGLRWGLPHLVGLLERSAARVSKRFPGSVLGVGDLSRRGGGDVSGHHSHESGRDVDVAFYAVNSAGKSVFSPQFVTFDDEGRGGGLRFDDARNWALIEAMLSDPQARVSHIFVAAPLRDRLLAHARRINAPAGLRNRAAVAMMQPKHGLPHDNHFHVRIACPQGQRAACIEYVVRENKPETRHNQKKTAASKQAARPVIAKARKRVGTTGKAAPALVRVVPAPNDFDDGGGDGRRAER